MNELIDRVWEYAKNNPDGFTLNIETMKAIKFGISVAYKETQGSFGKESLEKVIKHALENYKTMGGWPNEENGNYYFDSIKIFKNSELPQAIEFGKENDQIAIFDLTNLKELRL